MIGTNDLAKETHARIVPGRAPMRPWLATCIAAARAYGIDILDGVYNDIGDAEGFARECAEARDMGFDGKTIVHPSQIAACNAAFSPDAPRKLRRRARSSRCSIGPTTRTKAWSISTAAWSSACTPTSRGARWRLRKRSSEAEHLPLQAERIYSGSV